MISISKVPGKSAEEFWNELLRFSSLGLCSHARPDGDAIGSQVALFELLRAQGKRVITFNVDPIPDNLRFLPGTEHIQTLRCVPNEVEALVFIECTTQQRAEIELSRPILIFNLDHHPVNTLYGNVNWVDPQAPCVGTMILELQQALNLPTTPDFFTACYTALISDTGNFAYNLSARAFHAAFILANQGVKCQDVYLNLYGRYPLRKLRLLASVLGTLEIHRDGWFAWMRLTRDMLAEASATYADIDGFVDFPLRVQNVEISILFKEITSTQYRVSLRSNGNISVLPIAEHFGGGGHRNAAACTLNGEWQNVLHAMINFIQQLGVLTKIDSRNSSSHLDESVSSYPFPEEP